MSKLDCDLAVLLIFDNLLQLNSKIKKSTKELLKLNAAWKPSERDADQEMLTEEERECFRKIGLKMRSVLVLGKEKITVFTQWLELYMLHSPRILYFGV